MSETTTIQPPSTASAAPPLDTFLRRHLTGQMLRYQVGQQMFCPTCERILDWQNAVSLDLTGKKTGKLYFTKVFCGPCFDGLTVDAAVKAATEKSGEEIEVNVTDGRAFLDEDEKSTAKVSDTPATFRHAKGNWTRHAVQGYRVEFEGLDWGVFFLYHNDESKTWYVCDEATGAAIGRNGNRDVAVREAERALRKAGKKKFLAAKARLLKQQREHQPQPVPA